MAEMTEDARLAIYGYNEATGRAYTPEESAAASGGYNPYAGYTETKFDPVKGELTAINPDTGQSVTLGAKFEISSTGNIIPAKSSRPPGVGYDDSGRPYAAGYAMPDESLEDYIARMSQMGPGQLGYKGKQYEYNSRGMFYEIGTPQPENFGDTLENMADTPYGMRAAANVANNKNLANGRKDLSSFVSDSSDSMNNPYEPGTQKYEDFKDRRSAYDLLYSQFKLYGLESLVEPLKGLIISGSSPSEFTIRLRESEPYKKRFSANAQRVAKGLKSLSEAEYIELEDQYQDVMRRYGLPETYYARGEMGIQEGFNKFLEGDVSPVELEDRISTAQKRVLNANPEVTQALKQFYPDITNSDILAYTLDPKNAIENIKRKVTTAEIGGAAIQSGLQTGLTRAEQLRAAGVTKDTAQQGFGTIAGGLERGSQLASIYGEDPYTQTTAEEEVFSLSGATGAKKQRQKITGLEKATFGGQSGISSGALARDRAGAY